MGVTAEEVVEESGGLARLKGEDLQRELVSDAKLAYEDRERAILAGFQSHVSKPVVVSDLVRQVSDLIH